MAGEFTLSGRSRVLVIGLGLGLAVMLAASLVERFSSTGLTVRHAHEPVAQAPATDEVGRLMQEVSRDPGNKAALMEIAERLMAMGSWDGAESFATRALALDPRDARTRYLLGVIRHNQGKHAEAAQLLEEALKDKDSAPMRYSLGVLYLHYLNEPARGVEHLSQGLHAPDGDESLRRAIREELEKAPLPGADGKDPEVRGDATDAAKDTGEAAPTKKARTAKTGRKNAAARTEKR